MLGQGTFGQVVHCQCLTSGASFTAGDSVAVKVIKNQNAFYHQVGGVLVSCSIKLAATAQDCHLGHTRLECWPLSAEESKSSVCLALCICAANLADNAVHVIEARVPQPPHG